MAVSLEQFVKQLEESGLALGDELKDLLPPVANPSDAEALARELVRQNKLTKYQVEQISKGKGKSLVLGNYVILDKLGQGGMGMVLKARHRRMDRIVALKVMSPAAMKSPDAVQRFHREVKAAAKLEHPNIVTAYDADEAQGTHFLVMQYVEGIDLSALVKKKGPLPVAQAIRCISQAARGLEFAHQRGVIHRDIKPANLLIDNDGTVKVLDMGLARIEGEVGAQAELTSTGAVMGTVDYMAPEQALSTKHADARSDIYSLGITLWYLLTGRSAYVGDTLMSRLLAHRDSPIPSLSQAREDVPNSVDRIFGKMVAKQPHDRYQSMTEVLRDLGPLHEGAPSATTPLTVPLTIEDSQLSGFDAGLTSEHAMRATATRPQLPTATYAPSLEAATEATILSGDLAQVTIPQTVAAGPSAVRSVSSATEPFTGPASFWRDRRLQLGLLVAFLLVIAVPFLFSRGKGHKDQSQLASVQSSERSTAPDSQPYDASTTTEGRPSDDPKPHVAFPQPHIPPPGAIPEPPPLEDWLKGRTILTVAQDGSGRFNTIQDALDALQPGQVVKVLDRGPYRESIRAVLPPDTGLISDVKTVLEAVEWPAAEHAIRIEPLGACRIHGVRFQALSREGWFHVLHVPYASGIVIENCSIGLIDSESAAPCLSLAFSFEKEHSSSSPNWVRDCLLERGLGISAEPNSHAVPPPMIIEHNFFRGVSAVSPYQIELQKLVIRHNVFDTPQTQALYGLRILGVRESLEILNNTVSPPLGEAHTGFAFYERTPPPNVIIRNNVSNSSVICDAVTKEDRPKLAQSWQSDHNSYLRKHPKSFTSASDIVGPTAFLSVDPQQTDAWRIPADSHLATGGAGGDLPSYIGALPPGPAPKEGDWFTRLQERWIK